LSSHVTYYNYNTFGHVLTYSVNKYSAIKCIRNFPNCLLFSYCAVKL